MRFAIISAVLVALAGYTLADDPDPNFDSINKPAKDESIQAGSHYAISWTVPDGAPTGKVTIELVGGKSQELLMPLKEHGVVATGVDNAAGKYDWYVDSGLGKEALYGLKITLESDKTHWQWSQRFHIVSDDSSDESSSASPSTTGSGSTTTSTYLTTDTTAHSNAGSTSSALATATSTAVVGSNTTLSTSTSKPSSSSTATGGGTTSAAARRAAGSVSAVLGAVAFAALML